MKAFLVILLFLNIAVFAGYNYFKASQPGKSVLPPTTAANLVLADEQSTSKPKQPPATTQVASPAATGSNYCVRVAPIFGVVAVDELAEWLDQKGIDHQVEEKEFEEISNYWVYIPALPSIDQARVILKELRGAGIDDVYVIEAGRNRNSISLGLYHDKGAADNRVTTLSEQGIEVQIQPRTRKVKGYQLQVVAGSEEQVSGLVSHLGKHYPTLKSQEIACE